MTYKPVQEDQRQADAELGQAQKQPELDKAQAIEKDILDELDEQYD